MRICGVQASRDVDAVPEEVSTLHHHVAHMQPDAEADLTALRERLIGGCECLLDLHGALNRVYDTREFRQDAVSSRVGNPAPVLADEPVHDLPMSRQRPDLVHPHETRVALHVGREDGREMSLDLGTRGSAHAPPVWIVDNDVAGSAVFRPVGTGGPA